MILPFSGGFDVADRAKASTCRVITKTDDWFYALTAS
jgi:hypothetical protein